MNKQKENSIVNNVIAVTIICVVYNHERYLRATLESFVSQKTNFKFEAIVRDDASTDNSQDIIKEYAEKYPDIIRPILLEENTFSRGINTIDSRVLSMIKGKYVAFCEGDDCWTDENKLQIQIDFLLNHPKYTACGHDTLIRNMQTGKEWYIHDVYKKLNKDCDISFEEIVTRKNLFHTTSFVLRTDIFMRLTQEYNEKGWRTYDYCYMAEGARYGGVRYIAKPMSMYRSMSSPDSHNVKLSRLSAFDRYNMDIIMINHYDEYSEYRYHHILEEEIKKDIFKINNQYERGFWRIDYLKNSYIKLNIIDKIAVIVRIYMPKLYKTLKSIDILKREKRHVSSSEDR